MEDTKETCRRKWNGYVSGIFDMNRRKKCRIYIYLGCQDDIWYARYVRYVSEIRQICFHVWRPSAIEAGARYEWARFTVRGSTAAQWPIHCRNFHVQEEIKEEQVLSYPNRPNVHALNALDARLISISKLCMSLLESNHSRFESASTPRLFSVSGVTSLDLDPFQRDFKEKQFERDQDARHRKT